MPQVSTVDRVVQCVYRVLDEFNAELPPGLKLRKSMDTMLYGPSGQLDSLNLVQLIVSVEQQVEQEFGVAVTLADERALSQRRSPFATIASLTTYIHALLEEDVDGAA